MQTRLKLNDDVLAEILGYLPALDVLRCRLVCRRLNHLTRERFLWSTTYRHCSCPLPTLNLATSSVAEIERIITHAEILHKKWTATYPNMLGIRDLPVLLTGAANSIFIGSKGSYLVFFCKPGGLASFCWFNVGDTGNAPMMNPIFRYDFFLTRNCDFPSSSGVDCDLSAGADRKTGVLHVASVLKDDGMIFVTSIESGPKFQIQTRKIPISLWRDASCRIKVIDDYILCRQKYRNGVQVIDIIHIQAWKKFRAVLRSKFPPIHPIDAAEPSAITGCRVQFVVTPHYFIQILDSINIEVYDLPGLSGWTSIGSKPIKLVSDPEEIALGKDMRPIFSRSLPCMFIDLQVLPSMSPSSLIIVGAGDPRRLERDSAYHVALMSLDIEQHSIQTIQEVVLAGYVLAGKHNRLILTHAPATHCAAGILVTLGHPVPTSGAEFITQTIRYIQISLGAEPEVSVNDLRVPAEVVVESLYDVDIFGGSLIFESGGPRVSGIQKRVSILRYI